MTTEYEILFNKALSILDENLEIIGGKIIGNRFATAHKIISFAQEQVNNLDIPVVSNCSNCNSTNIVKEPIFRCKNCNCFHDKIGQQL